MPAPAGSEFSFQYISFAQEVVFAPGVLVRLAELAEKAGWKRLLLCTGRSQRANGQAGRAEQILGERLAAAFDRVLPHVQDVQVEEAMALAAGANADAVIGLGGGSAIGMAKAVAHRAGLPAIAIPTTYAGSEMTGVVGITQSREQPPRKITISAPNIAPRLVLYDPELTLGLPPELTASTGVNALAHCIEALYSTTRHPASTAAAIRGIGHIAHALLRCTGHGDDLPARSEMLLGAHLAGFSLAGVAMGLHHGLCHVLGGTANVPHGIANAIILPHAMRFKTEIIAGWLLPAATALGVAMERTGPEPAAREPGMAAAGLSPEAAVEAAADKIAALVRAMKLPQRLREAGVQERDLPELARLAFENHTVRKDPRPVDDPAQLEALLRGAW